MSTEARSGDLVAARYRLESLLGRGGMGRVWRGRDEVLEREVAVKELLVPPGVDGEEADTLTRRMVREAQAAARLVHHAIATVYDVVIHDDRPWIVMQLAPGRALDAIIRADGPLPPVRAAGIALQILGALDVAHNAGVVHRDVKPGNVIVQGGDHSQLGDQAKFDGHIQLEEDAQRDDGASHDSVRPEDRAVLTDFGIAVIEGDPTLTNTGMVLGSPTYLAPERARGDAATPGSDLWSVGATLYAMVEGRPPYQRESSLATLAALVNEPPAPHQQQGLMAAVLDGLLRKDPAQRMPGELAAALLSRITAASPAGDAVPPAGNAPPLGHPAPQPSATARQPMISDQSGGRPRAAARAAPMPVSAGAARPNYRRGWLVLIGALAVTLSAALLASLLNTPDSGGHQKSQQAPPSENRGGSRTPSSAKAKPSAAPSEGADSSQIPDGFRRHRDPTGFALAVPNGWNVSHQDHFVYVRDPDSGRFLLIDQTNQPKDNAVADWRNQEAARRDGMQNYERVRIEHVDYFREAADWEFRHTRNDVRLHVVNRGFVTSDDQAYGMYWSTPEAQWDESLRYFQVFARTFQPAS